MRKMNLSAFVWHHYLSLTQQVPKDTTHEIDFYSKMSGDGVEYIGS